MGDASIELPGGIGGYDGLGGVELVRIRGELEESALVGARAMVIGDGGYVHEKAVEVVKKRRGRPPRAQGKVQPSAKENDEEDVCFICFDGGSLVLCDRRGCPKAYHPACIKRDEAFFQSAARWDCGWHICSICQKPSHFMCYTCTFSLCKGCTKGADFMCVRGNKGFCNICLNMVKLIENMEPGNKETVRVDFDDKTSWEYLFKVYWIYLKTKLCLTSDELVKAKRVDMSVSLSRKGRNSGDLLDSDFLDVGQAMPNSKRRKTSRWPAALHKSTTPRSEENVGARVLPSLPNPTQKASKELLEFVSHMKKSDTTFLTSFDAQSLLLNYIKINGLRDPNCQSQIICDSRLRNLFGKPRLGHIEMLKHLEYHFQSQEDSRAESAAPVGGCDANGLKLDAFVDANGEQMLDKDLRFRDHKKDGNKGVETNCDVYAAVDMHNINLIYMPLHLMEKYLADDEFHKRAVGSVVRIKMSSSDQKQDMYRLVQVVGTVKVNEPYKVRNKFTCWKLEILNISKKEVISIEEISDQDFSEDECKRFRQSIKYGLATRLKVREVLEKAMALQTVKVANYLEREILRLSHLRDRASEKGQTKEFKDYVDKIELLNSPGECQRLQNEVLEVHEDLNMDPGHQSEEDSRLSFSKKHGDRKVVNHSGTKCWGGNSVYLPGIDNDKKRLKCGANEATELSTSYKENKKALTSIISEKQRSSFVEGKPDRPVDSNALNQSKAASASNQFLIENEAVRGTSVVMPSAGDFETEKIWHYQDPSWNIQGPFSILQLRKWNSSGYFPLDLRIWRTGEKQDESILLTDALDGQLCKKSGLIYNTSEISIQSNGSSDFVRSSCSSSLSTPAEIAVNSRDGQCVDSMKSHESLSSYSQLSSSPSTQTLAGKACEVLSLLAQERWNSPRCTDKGPGEDVLLYHSSPVRNLKSEELDSQKAEKKEVNLVQTSYADNIKDSAADGKQSVPLNIPLVDSCHSSITDSVHSNHQLKPTFNSCSIPLETLPTCSMQSATYVLPVELEPVPVNHCHLANGDGRKEADAVNNQTVVGTDMPLPDAVSGWNGSSFLGNACGEPPMMSNTWSSNTTVGSLSKPDQLAADVTTTQPTTDGGASPFQFWHSIFGEDDEFPFADESVSDLLAEVDAMECLNGPTSPTSAMVQAAQFPQTSKEDCFASTEDLNLTLKLTKGYGLNSSGNLQISCPPCNDQPTRR